VCDRWLNSVVAFIEDIGRIPDGMELDRRDNSLGYCCGKCDDCHGRGIFTCNCRLVTSKTNQRNRTDNHLITLDEDTKALAEWAELLGINRSTLRYRLVKLGWSPEKTLTTPVRTKKEA